MAEVLIGDIVARLRGDVTQFTQALQQASAQFRTLTQATGQVRQQQAQTQQSTSALASAYVAMARSIAEQTRAYAQAQQASLAYRREQDELRESLRRQREEQQRASSGLQSMLTIAGGVGIATSVQGIVSSLKQLVVGTVEAATRMEQLRATITAISGDTRIGAGQFQFLVDTSQRLGFSLTTLAEGFRQISGATRGTVLAGAETQKIFEAVATAARAMGASQQNVERALLAIGQVISKGTVQMEELRGQLAEAIPGATQIAARALGVTTERLNEMVAAGEVRAIPFVRALARQMMDELAPAARQAGETAATAFSRLGNEILLARDALANSGLMQMLKDIAGVATESLAAIRKAREERANFQETFRTEQILGTGLRLRDVTPEAQAELDRIRRQRAQAEERLQAAQQGGVAGLLGRAALPPGTAELLESLKAEEQAIFQNLRTLREQRQEQERVQAEVKRTRAERQNEADILESIRAKLQTITQQQETFRRRAAAAPEIEGALQGTAEQRETFRKNQQELLKKSVVEMAGLVAQLPPGSPALASEEVQRVRALSREYGVLGKQIEDAKEAEQQRAAAGRAAESAANRAARQAIQDQEAYQRAIDQTRMAMVRQEEEALRTLAGIQARFFQSREERAIDTVIAIQERFPGNEAIQAQAAQVRASLETRDAYLAEVEALNERFAALKLNADAMREQEQVQARFREQIASTLEQLTLPAEERREARLRRLAAREGIDLTPQDEAMLRRIPVQERLNAIMETSGRIGESAAQTITNGLLGMINATQRASEAFKNMGKSILETIAQITLNQGFSMLINLGLRAAFGAVAGGVTGGFSNAGASAGGGAAGFEILMAQGGAVINKPTALIAGENRSVNPEVVLNRPQLNSLIQSAMRAGPSAGGQATGGISIINVPNQEVAAREAAAQRSMGREVIINTVMSELSAGSGSRIGQVMKTVLR